MEPPTLSSWTSKGLFLLGLLQFQILIYQLLPNLLCTQCWSLSIVEMCMWREGLLKLLSLLWAHVHIHTCKHTPVHTHTSVHTHPHTHTHMNTNIHVHTHTHTHNHIWRHWNNGPVVLADQWQPLCDSYKRRQTCWEICRYNSMSHGSVPSVPVTPFSDHC